MSVVARLPNRHPKRTFALLPRRQDRTHLGRTAPMFDGPGADIPTSGVDRRDGSIPIWPPSTASTALQTFNPRRATVGCLALPLPICES
jgi:hypothetical protein